MTKVSFGKLVWVITVLFAVFTLTQFGLMNHKISVSQQAFNEIQELEQPKIKAVYEFKIAVIQIQQWLSDISATRAKGGLSDGFTEAEKAYKQANNLLVRLQELQPEKEKELQVIQRHVEQYYVAGKKMAQAYIDGGASAGNQLMPEFDKAAEVIIADLAQLLEQSHSSLNESLKLEAEAIDEQRGILISTTVINILLIIFLFIMLKRVLLRGLEAMSASTLDFCHGEGDLSVRLNEEGQSELSALAANINCFVSKIAGIVVNIKQQAQELDSTVGSITEVAESTQSEMGKQRASTEHAVTAIKQMLDASSDIAENTALTSSEMSAVNQETSEGQQVISDTVAAISELEMAISGVKERFSVVESESNNIGTVLDVIQGISEQTNLLALNAAIEAARAGEQGRGFAVVADEVRTLAQRTQDSTSEIQKMISSLQEGTQQAVIEMNAGAEQINTAVELVSAANDKLRSISDKVDKVTGMNQQVAAAAEEQKVVSNEIQSSMQDMMDNSELTAGFSEKLSLASTHLSEVSHAIDEHVAQFKVD